MNLTIFIREFVYRKMEMVAISECTLKTQGSDSNFRQMMIYTFGKITPAGRQVTIGRVTITTFKKDATFTMIMLQVTLLYPRMTRRPFMFFLLKGALNLMGLSITPQVVMHQEYQIRMEETLSCLLVDTKVNI